MTNSELIMTVAVGVGAVLTGIMNMIKAQDYVPAKYIPLVALLIGIIVGVVGGIFVFDVEPILGAIAGVIAGLSSVGFYEGGKAVSKALGTD